VKKVTLFLFPILALLCSCEDVGNDYRYPSVITDYTCITTDADGTPELLQLDNGQSYPIGFTDEYRNDYSQLPSYKADTTYRVISIYEVREDSIAYIYSMKKTISHIPTPLRDGERLFQDPVYLQSCWCSGSYLNIVIELKALDGEHHIGFIDTTPRGMRGKEFTFFHNANNDTESYHQRLYASIPLAPFKSDLQQGDTLRLAVNTYDEGIILQEYVM
jgi:hypothetical protein